MTDGLKKKTPALPPFRPVSKIEIEKGVDGRWIATVYVKGYLDKDYPQEIAVEDTPAKALNSACKTLV